MTEPKRWQQDGAPTEFGAMFSAVRSEVPSEASLQRALTAAGILGAVATQSAVSTLNASGVAGGVTAKTGLFGLVAKIAAVSLLGAAAVGVTVGVVAHRRADTARVVAAVPAKALQPRVGASDPAERSAPVPLVQNAVIDPSALPLIPTSVQGGAASSARRASHSAANTDVAASLLEQMALIDRARASLRAGDASHALQSVTEYRRKYPGGNFAPEALFLQMQASKQLGQATLATQAARELVERYPNAPNVSRARDLLQSQTSTQNP